MAKELSMEDIDKDILASLKQEADEKSVSSLLIFPTHYKITNYSDNKSTTFEEFLSVWDKALFTYTYEAYIIDEYTDEIIIPGGIKLEDIYRHFPDLQDNTEDHRQAYNTISKYNRPIKVKFKPRDDTQRKAIEFLMDSKYSTEGTQKMLSLNTGDGKTYCAVKAISMSKRIPMIFVNKKSLVDQWVERIQDYTDTIPDEIYLISGKASIKKLLKTKQDDLKQYKFFMCMHRTMTNYIKDDNDLIDELFKHLSISLKIYDEAHLEYENINTIDMLTYAPSLYVTATPSRSNYLENRVYQIVFNKVYKFSSSNKKIKKKHDKYHRVVIGKYNSEPSEEFIAKFKKASRNRGFNIPTYSKYILEEKFDYFYDPIRIILTRLIYPFTINDSLEKNPQRSIILVKQIALVEALYDKLISDPDIDLTGINIGRYHSKIPPSQKERVLEDSDLIITTDSSMSTGMDIDQLQSIISTIPTSSSVLTEQMLGRLRYLDEDREVMYYDLVDVGFEECISQLNRRRNGVYKRKVTKLQEVDL